MMSLHSKTNQAIKSPRAKLSAELQSTIEKLVDLLKVSSPMSDINYVFYTNDIKSLPGLKFQRTNASWTPIRNVIRIIAQISQLDTTQEITEVYIQSMKCGCDFFEGEIKLTLDDEYEASGRYRWQWSAFPGRETSFDKFTEFPKISTVAIP